MIDKIRTLEEKILHLDLPRGKYEMTDISNIVWLYGCLTKDSNPLGVDVETKKYLVGLIDSICRESDIIRQKIKGGSG